MSEDISTQTSLERTQAEGSIEKVKEKKTEDKVIIHTMPKRFFSNNAGSDKSKNVGVIIISVGVVFMLAIAGFLYFFLIKPSESPAITDVNTQAPAEVPATSSVSKEAPVKVEPPKEEVKVNIDIPEENAATNTEEIIPEEIIEEILTPEVEVKPPVVIKSAVDTDKDGLTDAEEELFSTIVNLKDSDGDGYDDLSEILGLYNPTGDGSIILDTNVDKYTNLKYGYSLYYIKKMVVEKIGGSDDSIMFKFFNGQSIQIIVEPNTDKLSIEEWYKKQFNVSTILGDQRVYKKGWTGVRSEDGLVVYLVNPATNYIYTLAYNIGVDYTLTYRNIFDLMINSFELK